MPTPYFSKFPLTTYNMNGDGITFDGVRDIIHRVQFLDVVLNNTVIMLPYVVKDAETPEIIAAKLYGSPNYHWVVLFANKIFNLWTEWPLSYDQFIAYLTEKYGSPDIAQSTIHHYEDVNGNIIDQDSYNATLSEGSISVSVIDFENATNDAKKNIILVDPKYLFNIELELDKRLAS
jgi:hypothetical protein